MNDEIVDRAFAYFLVLLSVAFGTDFFCNLCTSTSPVNSIIFYMATVLCFGFAYLVMWAGNDVIGWHR
jgi:hypothetical protein